MEMNQTGKFFGWSASWLQQMQWPVRWQDWRLPVRWDRASAAVEETDLIDKAEDLLVDEAETVELVQVADDLAQLMTPALPDPHFRAELKATLLSAHARQGARRNFFPPIADSPLRSWQVIATVPVVVGVAALIWRYSQRSASQPLEAA